MRVVVTGGAGYIGSMAVARLVARGDDVVVIDNLCAGPPAALPDGVPLARVDICDRSAVGVRAASIPPRAVLHFAALTIAPESVRDPAPYWRVNTGGTLNVLDAMRDAGVPAIVFSSTAAVYGTPEQIPISEDAPLQPINPYGASKLAAERAVASYADAYGLAYAALRYFNVAGASGESARTTARKPTSSPVRSSRRRVAGAARCLRHRLPHADGTAIRDYVHVDDLIDAHCCSRSRRRWRQLARRNQSRHRRRRLGARSSRRGRARHRDAGAVLCRAAPRRSRRSSSPTRRARKILGWQPAPLDARRDGRLGLELAAAIPSWLRHVG